jgi:hypothetical protein
MSFYVQRMRADGQTGWVGPIRSLNQARREVAAWESAGYCAASIETSPAVRQQVRRWQREADRRLGRGR